MEGPLMTREVGRMDPSLSETPPTRGPLPEKEGWGKGDPWH